MQGSNVCGSSNAIISGTHETNDDNSFNGVHEAQIDTNLKRKRSWNDDHEDVEREYPVGYRFCPTDGELIYHYLFNKILDNRLPHNKILSLDLYQYHPRKLSELYKALEDGVWYFFTPRTRKYPNGARPSRSTGTGYWKATGADRNVVLEDKNDSVGVVKKRKIAIGHKKTLVYYEGKPQGVKTNWIMHEYRVSPTANLPQHVRKDASDMKLDDWVLCKIHYKSDDKVKVSDKEEIVPDDLDDQHTAANHNDHHDEYSAESANTDSKKSILVENNLDDNRINHHYNPRFELPPLPPSEDYSNCYSSHDYHQQQQLLMLESYGNNNSFKYMMNLPQPSNVGEFGIFQGHEHGLDYLQTHIYSQLYPENMPYLDAAQHHQQDQHQKQEQENLEE